MNIQLINYQKYNHINNNAKRLLLSLIVYILIMYICFMHVIALDNGIYNYDCTETVTETLQSNNQSVLIYLV